jgi:hypothetical protein
LEGDLKFSVLCDTWGSSIELLMGIFLGLVGATVGAGAWEGSTVGSVGWENVSDFLDTEEFIEWTGNGSGSALNGSNKDVLSSKDDERLSVNGGRLDHSSFKLAC